MPDLKGMGYKLEAKRKIKSSFCLGLIPDSSSPPTLCLVINPKLKTKSALESSAPSRKILERQFLRLHPGPNESETGSQIQQ
jgi:hypothetical protein